MNIIRKNNSVSPVSNYFPLRSFFDDFFNSSLMELTNGRTTLPVGAEISENDKEYRIKVAIPGIPKEKISIDIDGKSIRIHGSETQEEKDDTTYHYRSLSTSFDQTFTLPSAIDNDAVSAELKDGILAVTLPKAHSGKSRKVEIK